MLQVVPEFYDADITIARIGRLARLSIKHKIPTTFSPVFDSPLTPHNVSRQMKRVEEQTARGARVHPQMQTRPVDISFSLLRPSLFFARFPSWYRLCKLSVADRTAALRDAAQVEKLVAETGADEGVEAFGELVARGGDAIPAELAGKTLGEIAKGRGETPARALISLSLENGLDVAFVGTAATGDAAHRSVPEAPADAHRRVGWRDQAHLSSFAHYAGDTGYLFSEFVRKSGHFTLEVAVKKITSESAAIWGITNRGWAALGVAVDIAGRHADRAVLQALAQHSLHALRSTGVGALESRSPSPTGGSPSGRPAARH